MSEIRVRTVSWLLRQIAFRLDGDPILHNAVIEGEVYNFTAHSSGHWYFSLKDERASIRAVMWENDNLLVNFMPKDGDRIRVLGDVRVYAPQGSVQLNVKRMAVAGAGDLKARFDALFKKLQEQGLFSAEHKKPIPRYPMNIALVTGRETHARADVLNTLARRWPIAAIREYPVLVQGNRASADIIQALRQADKAGHDVILLCRGGGSAEDLWCFNDEQLAAVIFSMHTPLITGIGHEPDWTIADYVADLRAPTPTGAAERCSPDIRMVAAQLAEKKKRISVSMEERLEEERIRLDELSASRVFTNPMDLVRRKQLEKQLLAQRLGSQLKTLQGELSLRLERNLGQMILLAEHRAAAEQELLARKKEELIRRSETRLNEEKNRLRNRMGLLDAYSPLKVLERGYALVTKGDAAVSDAALLEPKDRVSIRFGAGSAEAEILSVQKEN
jgi:exodeoxyribonuclease VII large subunit